MYGVATAARERMSLRLQHASSSQRGRTTTFRLSWCEEDYGAGWGDKMIRFIPKLTGKTQVKLTTNQAHTSLSLSKKKKINQINHHTSKTSILSNLNAYAPPIPLSSLPFPNPNSNPSYAHPIPSQPIPKPVSRTKRKRCQMIQKGLPWAVRPRSQVLIVRAPIKCPEQPKRQKKKEKKEPIFDPQMQ